MCLLYVCMYVCTHVYMCLCMFEFVSDYCMYVCIFICVYVCLCLCVNVCLCILYKTVSAYISMCCFKRQKHLPTLTHCILNFPKCTLRKELVLQCLALPDFSDDQLLFHRRLFWGEYSWSSGWCFKKQGSYVQALAYVALMQIPCLWGNTVPEAACPSKCGYFLSTWDPCG